MPTAYSTLHYSKQSIYRELQSKLEIFQSSCEFQGVSFETVDEIYKAIIEDHPEYFWLSGASSGTTKTCGAFSSVTFRPELREAAASFNQIRKERTKLEAKASELVSLAKRQSYDVYKQILFLHDYLVQHTDYRSDSQHCYDAYGCLILGRAVCSGYAAAFQVLMSKLGIECGRVRGNSASALTGEVSHVWNYIRLSDGYYFVDVTWVDPVVSNGTNRDNLSHEYFCLSSNEIRLTHRFSPNQFIPSAAGTRYDYYRYHGLYTERYSYDAVKAIAQKQLTRGNKFSVKFGSQTQLDTALHDLMDNQRIYSIPGVPSRISYGKSKSGLVLEVYCK